MKISLALSGGGSRAAIFHLGALKRLAVAGLLEDVAKLSTVSGGSLVAALVFSHNGHQWPTSERFLTAVYPELRTILSDTDLFTPGIVLRSPAHWFRRARLLAALLESRWGVRGKLADLPVSPIWFINTTCLRTGKNWRFTQDGMGDWRFGWHYTPPFSLAEAAAASAAVPYVIGALKLRLPREGWWRRDPATKEPVQSIGVTAPTVELWDGGAYENLGLEPIYKPRGDIGGGDSEFVLVSDAGGPLSDDPSWTEMLRGNLSVPRLFDIASDQIRSLRSRMFIQDVEAGRVDGSLLRIGNSTRQLDVSIKKRAWRADYGPYLSDQDAKRASQFPTGLKRTGTDSFDLVARHGYEVADATLNGYGKLLIESVPWGDAQAAVSPPQGEPAESR
ncbi:conserved protein of unknown function (FabD/lysophospholipase-like domain 1-224) (plasmid) [Magnetospirillum sp. XM-1]|uniref:patatin-like phospholipase family protein n=1 Tax=Magnetospirillum sp. XM-1 TaxID=1663591 RepID=UPI00073E03CC|nr:patatin-like phospholipase family protein [Magnetospirillum sp. XM-1]CUW41858.1 conserved protein of unknown function (FabD/lysophospholipase-like domain 1-224) [Magnetospirillum sp. XM-1]